MERQIRSHVWEIIMKRWEVLTVYSLLTRTEATGILFLPIAWESWLLNFQLMQSLLTVVQHLLIPMGSSNWESSVFAFRESLKAFEKWLACKQFYNGQYDTFKILVETIYVLRIKHIIGRFIEAFISNLSVMFQ